MQGMDFNIPLMHLSEKSQRAPIKVSIGRSVVFAFISYALLNADVFPEAYHFHIHFGVIFSSIVFICSF